MRITFHEWKDTATARNLPESPEADGVQVWLAEVPVCEAEISAAARLLNESERSRAERFLAAEVRNEFIFGRALLRRLLGACLNVDPAGVTIDYGLRGKPRLAVGTAELDLRFNLAHSHSLVAIALARGREVGVDIEWMERAFDWSLIAGRVFSANELREFDSLPASQRNVAYFTAWTRKEACLKATGEGLTDGIAAIEVSTALGKPAGLVRLPTAANSFQYWEIHEIPMPEGYSGALVVESPK